MKAWLLALAVALVPLTAQAQTANESFFGYVPCTWISLPAPPYPNGANVNGCIIYPGTQNSVRSSFGNGLTPVECLAYQETSRALTGQGFCSPPVSR